MRLPNQSPTIIRKIGTTQSGNGITPAYIPLHAAVLIPPPLGCQWDCTCYNPPHCTNTDCGISCPLSNVARMYSIASSYKS
jgi:hypothetical protein